MRCVVSSEHRYVVQVFGDTWHIYDSYSGLFYGYTFDSKEAAEEVRSSSSYAWKPGWLTLRKLKETTSA